MCIDQDKSQGNLFKEEKCLDIMYSITLRLTLNVLYMWLYRFKWESRLPIKLFIVVFYYLLALRKNEEIYLLFPSLFNFCNKYSNQKFERDDKRANLQLKKF